MPAGITTQKKNLKAIVMRLRAEGGSTQLTDSHCDSQFVLHNLSTKHTHTHQNIPKLYKIIPNSST